MHLQARGLPARLASIAVMAAAMQTGAAMVRQLSTNSRSSPRALILSSRWAPGAGEAPCILGRVNEFAIRVPDSEQHLACSRAFHAASAQLLSARCPPTPVGHNSRCAIHCSWAQGYLFTSPNVLLRQDTVHMDGKRERLFRDGRRMVVFVNGTIKEEYLSGLSLVRFVNGDVKKAYKSGEELVQVQPLLHDYWRL